VPFTHIRVLNMRIAVVFDRRRDGVFYSIRLFLNNKFILINFKNIT
jgi:hypothetical protein